MRDLRILPGVRQSLLLKARFHAAHGIRTELTPWRSIAWCYFFSCYNSQNMIWLWSCFLRSRWWASEVAQQIKVLVVCKIHRFDLRPQVKLLGETWFYEAVFWPLHTCCGMEAHTCPWHTIFNIKDTFCQLTSKTYPRDTVMTSSPCKS